MADEQKAAPPAPEKADAGWVAALEQRIKKLEAGAGKEVSALESRVKSALKDAGYDVEKFFKKL